jgi:hypothetical protein
MGCCTENASSPQDLPPLYIITTVVVATHLGQHGSATLVEDTGGHEANCNRLIHLLSTRAWTLESHKANEILHMARLFASS